MPSSSPLAKIHLDPVGGLAGDMFIAALLDAWPECVDGLIAELRRLPLPAGLDIQVVSHRDETLQGCQFLVKVPEPTAHVPHGSNEAAKGTSHQPHQRRAVGREEDDSRHPHVPYSSIRELIQRSQLENAVQAHALAMFALLADAEARVHGVPIDDVVFHELGGWDSIIDFVGAGYLISTLSPEYWSWTPPPLGRGRVTTAHGVLPVPAPATVHLLRGMEVIDDGVAGERVTPTGAAILKHLSDLCSLQEHVPNRSPFILSSTGVGFGTRRLHDIPNVVRCVGFELAEDLAPLQDEVITIHFEIDDQTAEDLALGLDRVRSVPGVLEIYQSPVYAKKGRIATQVQVLASPGASESAIEACFVETATLGLRVARTSRRILRRAVVAAGVAPGNRVKIATRPVGELTAKAEIDDLARYSGGKATRDRIRRETESHVLSDAEKIAHEPGSDI